MNDEKQRDVAGQEQISDGDKLSVCTAELAELKNRFMRLTADFDNYKRRTDLDCARWISQAQEELLRKVISVLDDCERAEVEYDKQQDKHTIPGVWLSGFELIVTALRKILTDYGVVEVNASGLFDPTIHEAIMHVESAEHESGSIVNVLQKGYLLKGSLLRPAKVSVAK